MVTDEEYDRIKEYRVIVVTDSGKIEISVKSSKELYALLDKLSAGERGEGEFVGHALLSVELLPKYRSSF